MGATISPFRYLEVTRLLLHRLWETKPKIKAAPTPIPIPISIQPNDKGKARELDPSQSSPTSFASLPDIPNLSTITSALTPSSTTSPKPVSPPGNQQPLGPDPFYPPEPGDIYRLMNDERLMVSGAPKAPREIVVLCHGLYGFSTATPIPLFPSLKLHYWASVLEVLRERMGVKVLVVGVKGTGSIKERAEQMHSYLTDNLPKGTGVNFVAHSMGGLDCRYLISNLKPTTYTPLSLTTIGTPHRGSPFMDWCAANIGVGGTNVSAIAKATSGLPFSLKSPLLAAAAVKDKAESATGWTTGVTKYLLNIFDSPAYSNLTTSFLREFNPQNPDSANVKYTSVAGRCRKMSVLHPLWFPKLVLDAAAEKGYPEDGGKAGKEYEGNDGLVSVSSAKWGEFLGVVDDCHHWDLRGEGGLWPNGGISSDKPQGRPDGSKPGGWDWQGGIGKELGLGGSERKSNEEVRDLLKKEPVVGKEAGKAGEVDKDGNGKGSSSWDLAQVGQVIDWVTDLLPGEDRTGTGKKQMAEATREKEKEAAARGDSRESLEKKKKREKFDLARFYGGLMIKLREDGL